MEDNITPLSPDKAFAFACGHEVACFNQCCRDLNQFLTPYDILRLKKNLGLSSGKFLERYTREHTGPESGLPVIVLKTDPETDLTCPFVTPDGCRVYEDRPSSCRMYPLARVVSRSRETGRISEQYMLIREPHCLGHQSRPRNLPDWIKDRGLSIYNQTNDLMVEIISLKNRLQPGMLTLNQKHLFRMALYDLDTFRSYLTKASNRNEKIAGAETVDPQMDDTTLLRFGFKWIQKVLFADHVPIS
jgi:Fe-S-cluster containining protein